MLSLLSGINATRKFERTHGKQCPAAPLPSAFDFSFQVVLGCCNGGDELETG